MNLTPALGEASQQMVRELQKEKEAHPEQSQAAFTSLSGLGWQIRAMLAVRAIKGKILGTLCGWDGEACFGWDCSQMVSSLVAVLPHTLCRSRVYLQFVCRPGSQR